MFQISTHLQVIRFQDIIYIYINTAFVLLDKYLLPINQMPVRTVFTYILSSCLQACLYIVLQKTHILFLLKNVVALTSLHLCNSIQNKPCRAIERKGIVPPGSALMK